MRRAVPVTWRARAVARIHALHPAPVLITSLVDGDDAMGMSRTVAQIDACWLQALAATAGRLRATGTRPVYLDDTPAPKQVVPDCLSAHPRSIQRCAPDTATATRSGRRSAMIQGAVREGAILISPTPWFCSAKSCPAVVGDILVYRDESHVSGAYIRLLAPLVSERLKIPVRPRGKT